MATRQRLLIIGGGPIGLELALRAIRSGKWHVTVCEQGAGAGANVLAWGHVRLFSSWALNTTDSGQLTSHASLENHPSHFA